MTDTSRVILLHGKDEFAITAHIEKLIATMGDSSLAGMNIARFDGRTGLDFEALNNAVNAIPFLSSQRLVVLSYPSAAYPSGKTQKQVSSDLAAGEDVIPSTNRKKFIALLDHVPETTTLVLVEFDALKVDHWLVKWAQKARAEIHFCALPKRGDMFGWIIQETRRQGGQIDQAAAVRLAEMTGDDKRNTVQEITKLLTYANFDHPITVQDVNTVSVASAQESIFDLVDALGKREGGKAQRVLHHLLEEVEPFELWGMVIRQFRLLLQAREIMDERGGSHEIQNTLGLHEFVAQKIDDQARHFSMAALESIYHRLLEIDEGTKTSQVPLDLALDTFIVELAGKS